MTKLYEFLRDPLPGDDVLDDLSVHLCVLRQFIPPRAMPTVHGDGAHVVCSFPEWRALELFCCVIGEHARRCPVMIPYLTHEIDWSVTLDIDIGERDPGSEDPTVCVKPRLRLDRAAFVALALTLAYDDRILEGDDGPC